MSSGAAPAPRVGSGLVMALAGSIAFSGKAIIVKLAYRYGVDAVTLIMLRMLFAAPLFIAMAWWAGRGKEPLSRRVSACCPRLAHQAMAAKSGSANNMRNMISVTASTP